jgi:hypothetical protein
MYPLKVHSLKAWSLVHGRWDLEEVGPSWKSSGHMGCAFKGDIETLPPSSFSLHSLPAMRWAASSATYSCHDALPHGLKRLKLVSLNKPFLFMCWIVSGNCYNFRKLTSTIALHCFSATLGFIYFGYLSKTVYGTLFFMCMDVLWFIQPFLDPYSSLIFIPLTMLLWIKLYVSVILYLGRFNSTTTYQKGNN